MNKDTVVAVEFPMRPLFQIGADIAEVWKKPYFGAVPYIRALQSLNTCNDSYGADDGITIVLYALANMSTFRGADARRLKAELNAHIKAHKQGEQA